MNLQLVEKVDIKDTIEVVKIFKTIQGEGPFTGIPAVFIRFAGCSLQCPKCDTDYTTNRKTMTIDEIVKEVREYNAPLVVITGGEPFRQNVRQLVNDLFLFYFKIQVETNG